MVGGFVDVGPGLAAVTEVGEGVTVPSAGTGVPTAVETDGTAEPSPMPGSAAEVAAVPTGLQGPCQIRMPTRTEHTMTARTARGMRGATGVRFGRSGMRRL